MHEAQRVYRTTAFGIASDAMWRNEVCVCVCVFF